MKKSTNGLGKITKRTVKGKDGVERVYWRWRYTDPLLHKQMEVSAPSYAECEEKAKAILVSIIQGDYTTPQKITLAQWVNDNFLPHKQNNVEPGTYTSYESMCRLYIVPRLGRVRLTTLKRAHCQQFVDGLHGIDARYISNIAGVLRNCLQMALEYGYIQHNPADQLKTPRIERKAPMALSADVQAAFEAAAQESKYRNVFMVMLHTGMRISEALGLTWDNVDMSTGMVKVTGQLERKRSNIDRMLKASTKSHKQRVMVVPAFVVGFFQSQRAVQEEYKGIAGECWANADNLIFTMEDGSPLPHRSVEYEFKRIARQIGHPELTPHVLRKTFITNTIHDGEDVKTVSSLVGHSQTTITLETYTAQRLQDMRRSAERRQREWEKRQGKA